MALSVTQLRRAADLIDRSGLAEWFDAQLASSGHPGRQERRGRPRLLSVRTLLIGLALAALDNRELHLVRVRQILNNLTWKQRKTLRIPDTEGAQLARVTDRQISYLWCRIVTTVDPSPHFSPHLDKDANGFDPERRQMLQAVLDRILEASLDDRTTSTYAVDWTYMPSWARLRRAGQPSPDPDANHIRYENKAKTGPKYNIYGYAVHAVVRTRAPGQEPTPYLCERITLAPAATNPQAAVLPLIESLKTEGRIQRLLADRGYTMATADRWSAHLRQLGIQISMDLHPNQRGVKGTYGGALQIDGDLYCPAMPHNLHDIERLDHFASVEQRHQFFAEIQRRQIYAMKPHGKEKPGRPRRFRCPAAAGYVRCPLKPDSMNLPYDKPTVYPGQDLLAEPPTCCSQTTMSVPVEIQSNTRQTPSWGTPEWYDIYQRCRPAVESFFSMLTDPGKEHMDRGRIKMMGIAKTSILVAFWAAAANFRLIDAFERRLEREANPDRQYIPRKPRRRRAVPYTDRHTSTDPPPAKPAA